MSADWDFEHQRAETAWTVKDLIARTELRGGEAIALELQFLPGDGADAAAFLRKLKMFGYAAERLADGAVQAGVADASLDADAIWLHEERTTKLALLHGYLPDGWGFLAP